MNVAFAPVDCSCEHCRSMCERSTCLPTPAEARELIRRGYGGRLATYRFWPLPDEYAYVGPAPAGQERARNLPNTKSGPCTFYRAGLCELHDLGLKPMEGRMAHHARPWEPVRLLVAKQWRGRQFDSVLRMLDRMVATHGAP